MDKNEFDKLFSSMFSKEITNEECIKFLEACPHGNGIKEMLFTGYLVSMLISNGDTYYSLYTSISSFIEIAETDEHRILWRN
jgi:hypothetical protein